MFACNYVRELWMAGDFYMLLIHRPGKSHKYTQVRVTLSIVNSPSLITSCETMHLLRDNLHLNTSCEIYKYKHYLLSHIVINKDFSNSVECELKYITGLDNCVCLRIVVSNTYCLVFLFCFSSSCVPYVADFSGFSIFDCPFGML